MNNVISISTENFIKIIYKFKQGEDWDTRPGSVARALGISNAAATDMARKLAAKNLVNYVKYKQLSLTPKGHRLALNVIRKHRLWESFLYKTLNLSLHEIHQEAEVLEHLTSDFLANKIDEYLGKPLSDPHGDPIPTFNGIIEEDKAQVVLSESIAGQKYEICRLYSSEEEFFDFCLSNSITIGSTIWVEKQYESNKMTEILINQKKILLNRDFANIIYVKQI
jgi:DtxR family transcriptional regulator, Mn-dependent transcriptional regulator